MKDSPAHLTVCKSSTHFTTTFVFCVFILGGLFMVSTGEPAVTVIPVLLEDNFDTGNAAGATPTQWKANTAAGITIRIADASVTEPSSPPHCVELRDDSPKERAQLVRNFSPSESGKASALFKLKSLSTTQAGMQLRTAKGEHLGSITFLKDGVMRSEHQGGMTKSAVTWTPGKWLEVQIKWFADSTFNASLDGVEFVQHARFVTNGVPGRIELVVGSSTVTNKIAFVDNVKVEGVPPL
jgi:hypothetical protein